MDPFVTIYVRLTIECVIMYHAFDISLDSVINSNGTACEKCPECQVTDGDGMTPCKGNIKF